MTENLNETMTEVMTECNNYFTHSDRFGNQIIHKGEYTVKDNKLKIAPLPLTGAYIRIVGSIFNDGVYKVEGISDSDPTEITLTGLQDETFNGAVCYLSPPKDFIRLVQSIDCFNKHIESINAVRRESGQLPLGMLQSETFEGYNYTMATKKHGGGENARGGTAITWKDEFASDLGKYRRMFGDKDVIL